MTITQMTRGDTPLWTLTATQQDGVTPFDLAGYTIRMTAKRTYADTDADAVFQLSTDTGEIIITDAAAGTATIRPLRSSTSGLTADAVLVWDVQIALDGAPDVTYTIATGTLRVAQDVTITAP